VPERIIILSDLHLGRAHNAAVSAEALRPLWRGASHLVINGDTAEVHHPRNWARAARQTIQLFDLCEADGVQLTLLSGNHDPFVSDIRHLHLAGGEVFVTHGDVLHPAIAPWSPAAARMREVHDAALDAIEPESHSLLEARLKAAQHASHAEWTDLEREAGRSSVLNMLMRPWKLIKVLHYWRVMPRLAAEFLREHAPDARYMLIGHTHRPGIWTIGERTIINTGCFGFPGRPWAAVLENGELTIWRISNLHRSGYRFDDRPLARFALTCMSNASRAAAQPTAHA
jgi:UDP-2,3-diacylglucosamine pyrophosphatase LpxH